MRRHSSVGTAIRYDLHGPGIESRWKRHFPYQLVPALWSTQPPVRDKGVSFQGLKRAEPSVDQPPPSRVEVNLLKPRGFFTYHKV